MLQKDAWSPAKMSMSRSRWQAPHVLPGTPPPSAPRVAGGECGCMSLPWVGLSPAGWQFMHRGFLITFAASAKRARERVGVSTILAKAEGARSSTGFCARVVVGPAAKSANTQSKGLNGAGRALDPAPAATFPDVETRAGDAGNLRNNGLIRALGRRSRRRIPRNAPHRIADVVSDQQRARLIDSDSNRPPQRLAVLVDKTGKDVDRQSRGVAVAERHENHLVSAQRLAVPRSVLADEDAAAVGIRQCATDVEGQPKRSGMIAERVIGDDRLGDHLRLRRHPRIHMLSVIAVRPPIEAAVLHRSHVIRHEVAAEFVALVRRRPQRARPRLPAHAVGIAKPGGKYPPLAGSRIDLEDRGTVFLLSRPFSPALLLEPTVA